MCMAFCLYVCLCVHHAGAVPGEGRRGRQTPWDCSYGGCEPASGGRNWTLVLCRAPVLLPTEPFIETGKTTSTAQSMKELTLGRGDTVYPINARKHASTWHD